MSLDQGVRAAGSARGTPRASRQVTGGGRECSEPPSPLPPSERVLTTHGMWVVVVTEGQTRRGQTRTLTA